MYSDDAMLHILSTSPAIRLEFMSHTGWEYEPVPKYLVVVNYCIVVLAVVHGNQKEK